MEKVNHPSEKMTEKGMPLEVIVEEDLIIWKIEMIEIDAIKDEERKKEIRSDNEIEIETGGQEVRREEEMI